MSLEACMIIVDNSEFTRNGDFSPSRFQSQLDVSTILSKNKTGANAESSVGIVDTAGPTCHMSLVTDADLEKLLAAITRIQVKGKTNFGSAINVAMLALKHRLNKRQEQRIVAFVASPIEETDKELRTLGVRLKKNKVAIDVISFGENDLNSDKLKVFIEAANSGDNSHYIPIETTPHVVLTDALSGSPVFGSAMSMPFGGGNDDDLEMAIRLSLQEAQQNNQAEGGATGATGAVNTNNNNNAAANDEDALMAQAMAMSLGGAPPGASGNANMDVDEDLELAIRLSMQDSMDTDNKPEEKKEQTATSQPDKAADKDADKPKAPEEPAEEELTPEFIQSLVSNLAGVDPDDPNFKELLEDLKKKQEKEKDKQ